jgi:hypothetical protein
MTRLNLQFANDVPPEPRTWPTRRVLVWLLLFACLWLWIAASLLH